MGTGWEMVGLTARLIDSWQMECGGWRVIFPSM